MGKVLIIALILLVVIVVVVVGFMAGLFPWQREVSPGNGGQPVPSPVPTPVPAPAPVPVPTPVPAPPPPQGEAVKFEFAVTGISGSGLSRTVTAQVTNIGNAAAHNVWGKVEVFSQGSRVKLGGADYLRVDIGTVTAGKTVTPEVVLNFSFTDGLKIAQNGATFTLTISSDEYAGTFSYDYKH